ncbi:hypothetical protein, partial [Oscillatoria sp. HE19RPO]|uniref:hypothetical protein n=1 Tax=Oscillatoria sp. HE19RPO TaxID=2954806 RepID=UPI0020C3B466
QCLRPKGASIAPLQINTPLQGYRFNPPQDIGEGFFIFTQSCQSRPWVGFTVPLLPPRGDVTLEGIGNMNPIAEP